MFHLFTCCSNVSGMSYGSAYRRDRGAGGAIAITISSETTITNTLFSGNAGTLGGV